MQQNTGKALAVLGIEWQRLAIGLANDRIYSTSTSASGYKRTGLYRNSLGYQVSLSDKEVLLYSEVFYGIFLELGTWKMPALNIIRDAVMDNLDHYRRLIAEILSEGF